MNDVIKTSVLAGLALVTLALAALLRPHNVVVPVEEVGDKVFPDFTNVTDAASLKIVRFDSGNGDVDELTIANREGRWVLTSHKDYPADASDAQDRIRSAAINLMDLEILDVASEITADHAEYGVVEPDAKNIGPGEQGVGMLIEMDDAEGSALARLIIGKEVQGTPGQRFVRRPGQNHVYVVNINPEDFSARFEDWIDGNLLKVNEHDIKQIVLSDYNFDIVRARGENGQPTAVQEYEHRLDVTLGWNAADYKWTLDRLLQNRGGRLVPAQLLPDEELNSVNLNQLRSALRQIKIVDVQSKPQDLSIDLKAEDQSFDNPEAIVSLMLHGFYPVQTGPNEIQILSTEGEVRIINITGVEYVLRFGRTAGIEESGDKTQLKRFLMVSARVNESAIPQPVLEEVPADDADLPLSPADAPGEKDPAGETTPQATPGPASDGEAEEGESDGAGSDEAGAAAQDEADGAGAPDTSAAPDEPSAQEPPAPPVDPEKARRDAIRRENERKLNEYNAKVEKAKEEAEKLNERFADWYYVISEDVYRKIHLGRFDIVQAKEDPYDMEAFRELQEGGLESKGGDHDHVFDNEPGEP